MTSHGLPSPCSLCSTGLQLFKDFRMQSEVARLGHAVGIWHHGRHTLVGSLHIGLIATHLFAIIRSLFSLWTDSRFRLELRSVKTPSQPTWTNSCNRRTWAEDLEFWPLGVFSFSLAGRSISLMASFSLAVSLGHTESYWMFLDLFGLVTSMRLDTSLQRWETAFEGIRIQAGVPSSLFQSFQVTLHSQQLLSQAVVNHYSGAGKRALAWMAWRTIDDWVNNISMLRKHDLRLDTSIVIAWPPYMTSLYIQSQRGTCTWTPRQALCMGDCCKASPSEFVGCWKGRVYDAVMPLLPCFAQQLARMEPDTHGGGGFGRPGLPGQHWSWYTMIELHSKEASLGRRARGRGSERWGGTISDDSFNFKQES